MFTGMCDLLQEQKSPLSFNCSEPSVLFSPVHITVFIFGVPEMCKIAIVIWILTFLICSSDLVVGAFTFEFSKFKSDS